MVFFAFLVFSLLIFRLPSRRLAAALAVGSLLAVAACVPLEQTGGAGASAATTTDYYRPPLQTADVVYDPNIHSVQCFVATGDITERLLPPIVPLSQEQPIRLEFDRLNADPQRLVVKLQLCNADWSPTDLVDMQFLSDINEFYITEYYSSATTQVPYYHYRFTLPRVKLTGNYAVHVSDPDGRPLLTRRVCVYDNAVVVNMREGIPPGGTARAWQQVDFDVVYGALPIINPVQMVQVRLRQNYRWDNNRFPLQPTFVREQERRLDYQFFNFENAFPGGREFRFFDTRSLRAPGFNVAALDPQSVPRAVVLAPEIRRNLVAYEQVNDINGFFLTDNREYGNGDTNGDYAATTFQLRYDPDDAGQDLWPAGDIYAVGQMTDWQLRPEFKLTYNAERKAYLGTALLKQGYYNYLFAHVAPGKAPDYQFLEGSRFETENAYDLFVYYRAPGTRYDQIIAYRQLVLNGRNVLRRR